MAVESEGRLRYVIGRAMTRLLLSSRGRRLPGAVRAYAAAYLTAKRVFERRERRLLFRLLAPGMTVLDVGANIGAYTGLLVRGVGPQGAVHAFEPDPLSFAILRRRFSARRFPNLELNELALASSSGRATLYCSRVNRADNHLYPASPADVGESIEVEVSTVDAYRAHRRLASVDAVKIDVQGAEVAVLEGMAATMEEARPRWLWLELTPRQLRLAGSSVDRFWSVLDDYGYEVFAEEGGRLQVIADTLAFSRRHEEGFTNVLARDRRRHAGG